MSKKFIKASEIIAPKLEQGLINANTLRERIQSEIDYVTTSAIKNSSEGHLNGYVSALGWVCDYLKLLMEIQERAR